MRAKVSGANVRGPAPKEWGRGSVRDGVMFEYVDFLHFDFRGINLSHCY